MSEDLAFRIQLGIILPRMKEKIAGEFTQIVEELVGVLKEGTRPGDELSIEPIKEIIMKDLEIFLDDCILPDIEKKIAPPEEEKEEEEEQEEAEAEPEEKAE